MITVTREHLHLTDDETGRLGNRKILAEGVSGLECQYAGKTPVELTAALTIRELLFSRLEETFGSCEIYDGGNANIFVKRQDKKMHAVIRVRRIPCVR